VAISASVGGQALKGFEIVTLTSDGKDPTIVAPAPGGLKMSDFTFTWSPDGRSIAYPCSKGLNDERYAVCVANVKTGVNYRLTSAPSTKIEPYAWGPQGEIVSDCNDRDVCLVNAKTGQLTFVTRTGRSARDAYVFGDDLVWSPDGRTLAFTCRRNDQQDRRFCFLTNDGKLTVQSRSWNSVHLEGWTPDSKRIVWRGRFSGSQPVSYHEQNVDGSGLEPLPANAAVVGPFYSADGRKRLAPATKGYGLAIEQVSGRPPRKIIVPANNLIWDYAFQPLHAG